MQYFHAAHKRWVEKSFRIRVDNYLQVINKIEKKISGIYTLLGYNDGESGREMVVENYTGKLGITTDSPGSDRHKRRKKGRDYPGRAFNLRS